MGRALLAVQREGSGSVVYHLHSTLHLSHIGMLLIACAMSALPQPVRVYPAASVVAFWQKCGFHKVVTGSSKLGDDAFEWKANAALTTEGVLQKVATKVPRTGADAIFLVQPRAPSLQPTATHSQLSLLSALVIAARSGPGPKDSPWNLWVHGLGDGATKLLVSDLTEASSPLGLRVWHDSSLDLFEQSVSNIGEFLSCIAISARNGAKEISRVLKRISPSGVCALPICSVVSLASTVRLSPPSRLPPAYPTYFPQPTLKLPLA